MSSTTIREPSNFGKRQDSPTITFCRNGVSRKYVINPAVFAVGCALVFMSTVGYFGATAYLVLRDDLTRASQAKYTRTLHEYEDRIASLRSKLDRVTSRQMLDQQAIEAKVAELIGRQNRLSARGSQMKNLLEKAQSRGLSATSSTIRTNIVPTKRPTDSITTGSIDINKGSLKRSSLASLGSSHDDNHTAKSKTIDPGVIGIHSLNDSSGLFSQMAEAITEIDDSQRRTIEELQYAASIKSGKIAKVLGNAGIKVPEIAGAQTGGPFIPADGGADFHKYLDALDESLERLDKITWRVKSLPLANPVPGKSISSSFGIRKDPFNGRRAMHSGIDFRGKYGTPVLATGNGTIVKAGRKGGYGKVVEIRHSSGFVTRYAHLRRITVKKGQKVSRGQKIGTVGSTGRSTGPHLHYEVRIHGKAANPRRYLSAGKKLKKLL